MSTPNFPSIARQQLSRRDFNFSNTALPPAQGHPLDWDEPAPESDPARA